jgi:HAD superfamily hydrolase (TIGR01509 family)
MKRMQAGSSRSSSSDPSSRPPIRAVVFDCFGVIYDDAFKTFIEHYVTGQSPHSPQHYYELALAADRGHISDHDFYAELQALSGEEPAAIKHQLRDTSTLSQDVVAIIDSLRPHYQIGLLSNASRDFLDRFITRHNLTSHFDVILASSESHYTKPERGIFEEIAIRLNIQLSEMLCIDDSPGNVTAAQSYGIPSILYQNPRQLRAALTTILGEPQ